MMHYKFVSAAYAALVAYLGDHALALANASQLLGGHGAAKRLTALIDDLSDAVMLSRRLARELVWLERLLTLDLATDIEGIEAAHFAEIDPSDQAVMEICLLTDGYTSHLDALRSEVPKTFGHLPSAA